MFGATTWETSSRSHQSTFVRLVNKRKNKSLRISIRSKTLNQNNQRKVIRDFIVETIEVPEVPSTSQASGQAQESNVRPPSSREEEQPDQEPSEGPVSGQPDDASEQAAEIDPANVPVPTDSGDELV